MTNNSQWKKKKEKRERIGFPRFEGGTTLPISRRINAELTSPPWTVFSRESRRRDELIGHRETAAASRDETRVPGHGGRGPSLSIRLIDNAATGGRPVDPLLSFRCPRGFWDGRGNESLISSGGREEWMSVQGVLDWILEIREDFLLGDANVENWVNLILLRRGWMDRCGDNDSSFWRNIRRWFFQRKVLFLIKLVFGGMKFNIFNHLGECWLINI